MPASVLEDYAEAADIVVRSPRGAAALLRLAVEKLCKALGKEGTINDAIGALVQDGLDPRVQKSLDALRVIGNEALHPGTMDLSDDIETALSLFRLLNLIVEKMITEPKHVDEVFNMLPASKREAIAKRDGS